MVREGHRMDLTSLWSDGHLTTQGSWLVLGMLGMSVLSKMAERMIRHVEGNTTNKYWSEDINKLTEGLNNDSGKESTK